MQKKKLRKIEVKVEVIIKMENCPQGKNYKKKIIKNQIILTNQLKN